jgi:hypothetical protein
LLQISGQQTVLWVLAFTFKNQNYQKTKDNVLFGRVGEGLD